MLATCTAFNQLRSIGARRADLKDFAFNREDLDALSLANG